MMSKEEEILSITQPGFQDWNVISSRDIYDDYVRRNSLDPAHVVFERRPTDPERGLWHYPYPTDIWDYWINRNIAPNSDEYIDTPTTGDPHGGYAINASPGASGTLSTIQTGSCSPGI
jgi:hypothetical protein